MVAPGHLRIASPVTVDREAELAVIERELDEAISGSPRVVLIGGEAGVGKSRLVAEALGGPKLRGVRVVRGACLTLGRDIPYLPFAEILRALASDLPAEARATILGPAAGELALLLPELAGGERAVAGRTRSRPSELGDAPRLERLRLFEALLRIAERLAADAPLVAVIEDLQWADQASLALLAYLLRGMRKGPVLVLVTMRTDEMEAVGVTFLADLERDERVERVELTGLTVEHTAEQVAAIMGQLPDRPLVTRVHALTNGNPFFTEEILAGIRDAAPADDGDGWPEVSPRLRDILRARTGRLPDDARSLLRTVATTDHSVDGRLLAEVSGLSSERLEDGLRAAIEEQLLVAAPDGAGYRFRHQLVRAFVASEVVPNEAARLHAAFAKHLASTPTLRRSPGELAYHWDAAGDGPRAFGAHVEAGLAAEDTFAFEAASRHLQRALELWDRVADADDRVALDRLGLVQHAADAWARVGELDRAIDLVRGVLAEGEDHEVDRLAEVRSRLRWYLWEAGRIDEAVSEAERAVAALSGPGHERWRANAIAHLAGLRLLLGDVARSRRGATAGAGVGAGRGCVGGGGARARRAGLVPGPCRPAG